MYWYVITNWCFLRPMQVTSGVEQTSLTPHGTTMRPLQLEMQHALIRQSIGVKCPLQKTLSLSTKWRSLWWCKVSGRVRVFLLDVHW